MYRAPRILRSAVPWALIGALVFVMLLKFSTRSMPESILITAIAMAAGLLFDNLATQFRTHILGSWDRGT
jgi:hypothetical protein